MTLPEYLDADIRYIIKVDDEESDMLHWPVGTILPILKDGVFPEGWIFMEMGGKIPDEYPELKRLFAKTGDGEHFPDFRGHVIDDEPS